MSPVSGSGWDNIDRYVTFYQNWANSQNGNHLQFTLKTTMFLIQDQQTGFKSKSNELVNFIEKSYHSYLLVRIRLWQNSFVLEEDFKENTKYQRIRLARRTDKICFCLSLFLNALFLICIAIISAIWLSHVSDVLDLRNLQQQVRKVFCQKKCWNKLFKRCFSRSLIFARFPSCRGLRQQK